MKRMVWMVLTLVVMGWVAVVPVAAQICSGMVQCAAQDEYGGCSPDTGWENSLACTGVSCTNNCAGGCEISNGCSGGSGGTCFLPGTKVETAEGSKNIETMSVGDRVKSFDGDDKVVNASVSKVMKFSRDYYYELEAGDYSVKVTAEHPFYRGNGKFSEVKDLQIGDIVFILKNQKLVEKTITKKTRIDEKTDVYNMTVDNTHTYFANDFAVHNKIGGDGMCTSFPGTVKMTVAGTNSSLCCPSGSTVSLASTETRQLTKPVDDPGQMLCEPYIFPLSTSNCYVYTDAWGDDISSCTAVCPTYTCGSSCTASPPTSLSVINGVMNWTVGDKGAQQLIRVGSNSTNVMTGSNGGGDIANAYLPASAYAPSESFGSQPMYYYNQTNRSCTNPANNLPYMTGNSYTTMTSCKAALDQYVPQSSGVCYQNQALCDAYNVDSYTTSGFAPNTAYLFRVANLGSSCYSDATCLASTPTTPSLTSPGNGSNVSTTTVGLYWNTANFGTACGTQNNQYELYVGTTPGNLVLQTTTTNTSYNFNGSVGTTYYWRVQAKNGSLSTFSATQSFNIIQNQITGTVFNDTDNNCGGSPMGSGTVVIDGVSHAVASNGTFTLSATAGNHLLSVAFPTDYVCTTGSCGANSVCTNRTVISPSINNNFYLTSTKEAWWQTEGAGVYAGGLGGGVTVRSELPLSSSRLIIPGGAGTSAALLRSSGSSDLGSGSVSDELWSATARYRGKKMDYAYFAAQMGVVPSQTNDWEADTMNKPGTTKDFHYLDPQSGTATISSPWVVASGEKYIVFVNGDLRISANTSVDNGGFLAFIVNGNILVDPAITNIEGMYIATASFETESIDTTDVIADVPLQVEGNVVAWGTFELGRSLLGSNIVSPAEKFVYRPDLLENMPDKMKTFAMNWQEVAPGSFGE